MIEWTLDRKRLDDNPLMTRQGRKEIFELCEKHGISIASLTGDCFMQAPFFKTCVAKREELLAEMGKILESCALMKITKVVVPLVDGGRIECQFQEEALFRGLDKVAMVLRDGNIQVAFESDYRPERLAAFIQGFDPRYFGINYDTGNSASLSYDPGLGISFYGNYILNVHVKDRILNGGTVPLGEGNTDFPAVISALRRNVVRGRNTCLH